MKCLEVKEGALGEDCARKSPLHEHYEKLGDPTVRDDILYIRGWKRVLHLWPPLVQREPEVMCLRMLGNMLESAILNDDDDDDDETAKSVGAVVLLTSGIVCLWLVRTFAKVVSMSGTRVSLTCLLSRLFSLYILKPLSSFKKRFLSSFIAIITMTILVSWICQIIAYFRVSRRRTLVHCTLTFQISFM